MSDTQSPSAAELLALLEADRQRRVQAVQAAVQAALAEHGCDLRGVPQIVDGRIVAHIVIVPVS